MGGDDKEFLFEKLTEARLATRAVLEGVDPELRVYSDTDWRVKDILGHLAVWDREVAKSLRAFSKGDEYFIPDLDEDESEYNEKAVIEHRKLTTQQIYEEWEQAHNDFKEAIRLVPAELFPGDVLYPWGDERGSIALLVDYMIEHEVVHREEIENAIKNLAEK
jgi:hypothetical protein